jgi:hypothetical protein
MRELVDQGLQLLRGWRRALPCTCTGARQALGQDAEERVGEIERVHAHVEQADDRFRRAVRVQSREYQVARQRGLDARRNRLLVAHLPDHDHVGSARRNAFIAIANVIPALGFICTCANPSA